jgi:hypothetical protein
MLNYNLFTCIYCINVIYYLLITLLHIIKVYRFDKPISSRGRLTRGVVFAGWELTINTFPPGQVLKEYCGPGSSVGIATGYRTDRPGIGSRWG